MSAGVVALHATPFPDALAHSFALLVVLRYGCMIIEKRAWKDEQDRIHDWQGFNQGFVQPIKLVALVVFLALVHGVVTRHWGSGAGYAVLALANLGGPAAILIVALDDSFVGALSPGRVAAVIAALGFDYLAAFFVLALFSLTGNIVLDLLLRAAPPPLALFVYTFCSYYYLLAVFFMLAWLVARHREDLIG